MPLLWLPIASGAGCEGAVARLAGTERADCSGFAEDETTSLCKAAMLGRLNALSIPVAAVVAAAASRLPLSSFSKAFGATEPLSTAPEGALELLLNGDRGLLAAPPPPHSELLLLRAPPLFFAAPCIIRLNRPLRASTLLAPAAAEGAVALLGGAAGGLALRSAALLPSACFLLLSLEGGLMATATCRDR